MELLFREFCNLVFDGTCSFYKNKKISKFKRYSLIVCFFFAFISVVALLLFVARYLNQGSVFIGMCFVLLAISVFVAGIAEFVNVYLKRRGK